MRPNKARAKRLQKLIDDGTVKMEWRRQAKGKPLVNSLTKRINCHRFGTAVKAIASSMSASDRKMVDCDDIVDLKLGWVLKEANVWVTVPIKAVNHFKGKEADLISAALQSSEGRKVLTQSLWEVAKEIRAKAIARQAAPRRQR